MVTPATAGPFDLGTVVVRVALFVDPKTAQIHAVSDPIPHVFGGALLDIRSVDVKIDRPDFTLNPTSCEPLAIAGALRGGGADPADPAAFSSFAGQRPVPGERLRRARLQAEAVHRGCSAAARRRGATATRNCARSSSPAPATPTSAARR